MRTVRTLIPAEFEAYRDHLLRLGPDDRRLRFGGAMSDEAITAAVRRLSPTTSRVIAAFDDDLRVIGAVQLNRTGWSEVETAYSVEPEWRRRGVGSALITRAVLTARNLGASRMHIHCLRENVPMRRLARCAEMTVTAAGDEMDGVVRLTMATPRSLLQEMVAEAGGVMAFTRIAAGRVRRTWAPDPLPATP